MRPTQRPDRPYTNAEILDGIEKHFMTENNPRCTRTGGTSCIYGKTGCAVGCLMTAEDAATLDNKGVIGIRGVMKIYPDIYNAYFTNDQIEMLSMLQDAHDGDHHFFRENIAAVIAEWRDA